MDIREEKFRMTLRLPSSERYFTISQDEVMAILISTGKPVSVMLKDRAGEEWWVNLMKAHVDVDMNGRTIEVKINPTKNN